MPKTGKASEKKTSRPSRLCWQQFDFGEVCAALQAEGANLPTGASAEQVWEEVIDFVGQEPGDRDSKWFVKKHALRPMSRKKHGTGDSDSILSVDHLACTHQPSGDGEENSETTGHRNEQAEENSPIGTTDAVGTRVRKSPDFSSDTSESEDAAVEREPRAGTSRKRVGVPRKRTKESRGENSVSLCQAQISEVVAQTLRGFLNEWGFPPRRESSRGSENSGNGSSTDEWRFDSTEPVIGAVIDSLPKWNSERLERSFRNLEGALTVAGIPERAWSKYLARALKDEDLPAYSNLDSQTRLDYRQCKEIILRESGWDENQHRLAYEQLSYDPQVGYRGFADSLRYHLFAWLGSEGQDAWEKLLVARFVKNIPRSVYLAVMRAKPKTLSEAANIANAEALYLQAVDGKGPGSGVQPVIDNDEEEEEQWEESRKPADRPGGRGKWKSHRQQRRERPRFEEKPKSSNERLDGDWQQRPGTSSSTVVRAPQSSRVRPACYICGEFDHLHRECPKGKTVSVPFRDSWKQGVAKSRSQ